MRIGKEQIISVPAVILSVLPFGACPACWPVYAGVLSALGLTFLLSREYLLPLTAVSLLTAVAMLAFQRRRGFRPLALGLVAAALVLMGKFVIESNPLTYTGAALLVVASLWNAWPQHAAPAPCPKCAPADSGFIQLSAPEK